MTIGEAISKIKNVEKSLKVDNYNKKIFTYFYRMTNKLEIKSPHKVL